MHHHQQCMARLELVSLTVETCSIAVDVSFATDVKVDLVRTSSTVSVPLLHFSQLLQK